MSQTTPSNASYQALLLNWQQSGLNNEPPEELMALIRDEVLHTLAVHLAVVPPDGIISLQTLTPTVVDALGGTLEGPLKNAVSRVVSRVIEQFQRDEVADNLDRKSVV